MFSFALFYLDSSPELTRTESAHVTDTPEQQIMMIERRWVQAHRDLKPAEIEFILDEDYGRIEGNKVVGKGEVVASYKSGQRHWDVAEGSDYSVQIFDNFAVVVGVWRGVGVNHGERFDYRARFVSVYVKRQAGWKLYRDEVFEL